MEIPANKPSFNGKYKTKEDIESAISKLLSQYEIEGEYADVNWNSIKNMQTILKNNGIEYSLLSADFAGQGEAKNSDLPTKKIYRFELSVRDKEGKNILLFFKVTCSFVGKSGTIADKEYNLTYSFF